eukprot:12926232-Prorocentrum_lima.AAC.1
MAHWHAMCPHRLQGYEQLVFTINKQMVSAVIKRECDNLSPVGINIYHQEAAEAKLAELERWQDL